MSNQESFRRLSASHAHDSVSLQSELMLGEPSIVFHEISRTKTPIQCSVGDNVTMPGSPDTPGMSHLGSQLSPTQAEAEKYANVNVNDAHCS